LLDGCATLDAGTGPERSALDAAAVGGETALNLFSALFKARLEFVEMRLEVRNLLNKRFEFDCFYCKFCGCHGESLKMKSGAFALLCVSFCGFKGRSYAGIYIPAFPAGITFLEPRSRLLLFFKVIRSGIALNWIKPLIPQLVKRGPFFALSSNCAICPIG
jgi:hypothetical protein